MKYDLFPSIEAMLAPATLSDLTGETITTVETQPYETKLSRTGSHFMWVDTNEGTGPRYFIKRASLAWDGVMQGSQDYRCRSVKLWQSGLLDRLRPQIEHEIIACATEGEGWAILMPDLTDALMSTSRPPTQAEIDLIVQAAAHLHATFWEASELKDPELGLCTPDSAIRPWTPKGSYPLRDSLPIARSLIEGWKRVDQVLEPDVIKLVKPLLDDPTPVSKALEAFPHTLLHNDPQPSNLALRYTPSPHVIMFDWQIACWGPDCLRDLLPLVGEWSISRDDLIIQHRRALASLLGERFPASDWDTITDLAVVARLLWVGGWLLRHTLDSPDPRRRAGCREELAWCSERLRRVAKWL